jgi:hypothetical protein
MLRIISLSIAIFFLFLLSLTGCDNQPFTTGSSTNTGQTTPSSTSFSTTELPYRTDTIFTLSKAPKLGETADLTFTIKVVKSDPNVQPSEGLARSKAWIDFYWTNTQGSYSEAYTSIQIPSEEVIVSGELPWAGSYSDNLTLHSKIKLSREGIWSIRSRFYGEGWTAGAGREIEVAVVDGTAAIMGTEEFKSGPLAYLEHYIHGMGGVVVPNEMHPVSLGLDISKAPRPDEEVTLSCRINSVIDVPDFSIRWSFVRRSEDTTKDISATELLSDADLNWKADIRKGEPAVFSTKIKFPMGDWWIFAAGKSGTKYLTGSGDNLKLSITSTKSYYGWIERPLPPATTTSTDTGTKAIYDNSSKKSK